MSLFSKLKSRLMKTSSKLDEGLEAIVEDGGEESSVEEAYVEEVAAEPELPVAPDVTPEPLPEPTPEPQPIPESTPEPAPAPLPEELPTDVPQELPQDLPKDVPDTPSPDVTPPSDVAPLEMPVQVPAEVPVEMPVEIPVETVIEAPVQTPTQTRAETVKPGFLGRLLGRKETKTVVRRALDDDMLEQLEELLITADMGVETSMRVTAAMAEGRYGKKLSVEEIKRLMAQEVARIMEPVAKPMPLYTKTPQVVLVVGVNGSGKTTTIGKLASQFRAAGKSVVIAAGDTFRAAAVEQLQVWGERAGVPVLTAPEGSDPASLAFDAMTKAQETGADLLMIDTAGRLQNRADLMEELAKIVRVIRKKDETAPHNTLLVLDATTGQNAVSQVEIFQKIADVSGLVMTKLDGTAKGGVLVSLADKFGLPIHAIGVGEQIDDLAPFDPEEFAAALTGLEV
ncbi:signal recognition particle-docking protein FtsY [Celeribacter sp. HF31]|uniref:signal recognition particle-docking protein FtsY n=1 Tax=Celeribacter sp. HF31 TaxID=2721558 RepID=UPI001431154C|nr:signal recognition particle-docking protein FtsY [Celeribacter sp. HF31]NIY80225.1 signal recognition particle-docking protein FtsY [Celeribacter sp. HF31]